MKFYIVAFESGSRSVDADPGLGYRWEERGTCGHKHRTYEAAERCKEGFRKRNDAAWLSAAIHDQDGHRTTGCEDGQIPTDLEGCFQAWDAAEGVE